MKKLVVSSFVVLMSLNAHALVRSVDLKCRSLHDHGISIGQANAPFISLNCGIISSFGPEEMSCTALVTAYFPPPLRHEKISLREVAVTNSTRVFKGRDQLAAVIAQSLNGQYKAEVTYAGLETECAQ